MPYSLKYLLTRRFVPGGPGATISTRRHLVMREPRPSAHVPPRPTAHTFSSPIVIWQKASQGGDCCQSPPPTTSLPAAFNDVEQLASASALRARTPFVRRLGNPKLCWWVLYVCLVRSMATTQGDILFFWSTRAATCAGGGARGFPHSLAPCLMSMPCVCA